MTPIWLLLAGLGCQAGPAAPATVAPDPLHRLSPTEYDNAVRSLLQIDVRPSASFLPEAPSPFSNTSDASVMGDAIVEQYLSAAEAAVAAALALPATEVRTELEALSLPAGQFLEVAETGGVWWHFIDDASVDLTFVAPFAGDWTVELVASSLFYYIDFSRPVEVWDATLTLEHPASGAATTAALDGNDVTTPQRVGLTLPLAAGPHRFRLTAAPGGDNSVVIDALVARGAASDPADLASPARDALVGCGDDQACTADLLRRLGRRAWRRPLTEDEVAGLVALFTDALSAGRGAEAGVADAVVALLVSPHFLFRVELDPPLGGPRPVTAWELAARLSFALWSDLPDEALLDCAAAGGLGAADAGGCGLETQVDRMLADPRATAAVTRFGVEWLHVDDLGTLLRDPALYPTWGAPLAASMTAETEALLTRQWAADAPVAGLLRQPATTVDARLADHYGIPWPADAGPTAEFARPSGLLHLASVLTATSEPSRTSLVRRGVFIRSQLLCDPPDAPPPGVRALESDEQGARDALDAHLAPACASCHAEIDPWGVALEGFDAIGRPRPTWPDGAPVETTATLPDGAVVTGPDDLTPLIEAHLVPCLTQHALTWSLARRLTDDDSGALGALAASLPGDPTWRDLLRAVALSETLRTRRPAAVGAP